MTELTTHAAAENQLTDQSTDDLKQRLSHLLGTSAAALREMAEIVAELEDRGEDLSELRLGIVDHLRKIASGQLLPEVVVRCAGRPNVLKHAAALSLPDQQRLADGVPFDLAVWRGDRIEWRKVDPLELTSPQFSQLFASDHVRSQQEQISLLEQRREKATRRPPETKPGRIRINTDRQTLMLNRSEFTPAEVVTALAELAGDTDPDPADMESSVLFKLTDDERQRLKRRSVDGRTSVQRLVRQALKAHGLI